MDWTVFPLNSYIYRAHKINDTAPLNMHTEVQIDSLENILVHAVLHSNAHLFCLRGKMWCLFYGSPDTAAPTRDKAGHIVHTTVFSCVHRQSCSTARSNMLRSRLDNSLWGLYKTVNMTNIVEHCKITYVSIYFFIIILGIFMFNYYNHNDEKYEIQK